MYDSDPYTAETYRYECPECLTHVEADERVEDCPDCGASLRNIAIPRE